MWAAEREHTDTVQVLLNAGADSSLRDKVCPHHPCSGLFPDSAELSQMPVLYIKANKTAAEIASREDVVKIETRRKRL
jgi:hypothetical protein